LVDWKIENAPKRRATVSKPEMKGGQLLLATIAVLSASGSNLAQEPTRTPQFSSSLDLISLHVTVTDQSRQCFERYPPYWNVGWDGCPVVDLTDEAFEVAEDGVRQQIAVFNRGDVPIAVSLLVDTRSVNNARTGEVHEAATGLVHKLRETDLAEVRGFGVDGEVHQPLTTNRADLERAIRRISPRSRESAESLLLRLLSTFDTTAMRAPAIRRDAIIFLTDSSRSPGLSRALALARRSHVAIYTIALMGEQPLDETQEPASSLRRLAAINGGRAFFPETGRRLSSLYTQIYEELSRQYTIGYVSTNPRRDGAWRNLTVSVTRPHASARTKLGYLAPEP
jgi:VWFA-related protein